MKMINVKLTISNYQCDTTMFVIPAKEVIQE
jgi:hypothetical protein